MRFTRILVACYDTCCCKDFQLFFLATGRMRSLHRINILSQSFRERPQFTKCLFLPKFTAVLVKICRTILTVATTKRPTLRATAPFLLSNDWGVLLRISQKWKKAFPLLPVFRVLLYVSTMVHVRTERIYSCRRTYVFIDYDTVWS